MEEEHFCPNCGAILDNQPGFNPNSGYWVCDECGMTLMDEAYDGDGFQGVAWFCDSCGAFLNRQEGFSDDCIYWACTECGHYNHISEDEIYESKDDYEDSSRESEFHEDDGSTIYEKYERFFRGSTRDGSEREKTKRYEMKLEYKKSKKEAENKQDQRALVGTVIFLILCGALIFLIDQAPDFRAKLEGKIQTTVSSSNLANETYENAAQILRNAGFEDVETEPNYDLVLGIFAKEGEIDYISINGDRHFSEDDWFFPDAIVRVVYHAWPD